MFVSVLVLVFVFMCLCGELLLQQVQSITTGSLDASISDDEDDA